VQKFTIMGRADITPIRRVGKARKAQLTTPDRVALCADMTSDNSYGMARKWARAWGITKSTLFRIWGAYSTQLEAGGPINLSRGSKKGRPKALGEEFTAKLLAVPQKLRTTFRELGSALKKSHTTMRRYCKEFGVRRWRRAIIPSLSPAQKAARLAFVQRRRQGELDEEKDSFHQVHLDEKWFLMHTGKGVVLLARDEEAPPRSTTQHKSHIQKVMMVAVTARPKGDFDGKIGIYSCTVEK
jgi:hypothetical protein